VPLYPSIFSPAGPALGPSTNLTGRGVGRDLEARDFSLARARPEMLFLVILPYKMCGRPAQARAWLGPQIEARHVPWNGHGQDFLSPKNSGFLRPGPNPTRPVECSSLGPMGPRRSGAGGATPGTR
jgi:hypothetical protein